MKSTSIQLRKENAELRAQLEQERKGRVKLVVNKVYTTSKEQDELARKIVEELATSSEFKGRTIVTEIEAAEPFHGAEDYHQDYVVRTGRACHPGIGPAIEEFTERINLKNESK